ncbi:signal transduction histidine kinase (STHK), LytS [Pleurocapsa sp. CCALA 161]|uniref:general stress protein n=1 Tax=Pleurocapsa sp. CCALA 161 TaxID=2107688 RepID=UPI000D0820B0|nr:general stress protein [Pleurocapsa sp. CCALA 161]PSB08215.1 signal transduction histidine kinase (STHK), LytS [Pleurocapsa sp. CCALA 161]
MNQYKRSVGLFYSRDEAEAALRALKDDGFDMNRVNVIAKDADQVSQSVGLDTAYDEGNNAAEGAGAGASSGAVLGGITGLLVGLGTLAIPGVGPIIVAGEAATAIATTLAGAGIGAAAGGIIGGLVGLGIPEDKAKIYSDRVGSGSYLVMVNGTNDDISRAERILHNSGIEEYNVYDANDVNDDTYGRTSSVNRVNTNQSVTTMGDIDRSGVIEPNTTNTTDKVINTRTEATKPRITSDRTTTGSDADVIIIEPRDNQ